MQYHVLLLGTIVSEKVNKEFIKRNIRPAPADIAQQYIIEGLKEIDSVKDITIVSSPRIPSYPKVDVKVIENEKWISGKARYCMVGFQNKRIKGFTQRENGIVNEAKIWAKSKGEKIIIIYSVHSPFLKAAYEAKKIDEHIKVCLIVPDLPQFMGKYNTVKKTLKKIDRLRINRLLKCVDKYCLYTKYMADYFSISEDKWIVFEGLIDSTKIKERPIFDEKKICIYAGSLNVKYAIDLLIKAFELVEDDAELHIYGDPAGANNLSDILASCHKSKYMGVLNSDEMFDTMRQAFLLINPRPTNLELAKYSCPSKTFEYMATGTPVLMTRLPGVPDEYFKYMFIIEDESLMGFKKAIEIALRTDFKEMQQIGTKAQRFLIEEKSSKIQMERIISFIMKG